MILEPTPENLRAVRMAAELTQSQAAALVYLGNVTRWSEYERGARRIDRARWELFLIKLGMSSAYRPAQGVPVPGGRGKAAARLKAMES